MKAQAENSTGDETEVGQSILAGLNEAVAWSQGKPVRVRKTTVRVPVVNVQKLRARMNLDQARFAAIFAFTTASVRNWEQGRRRPQGSARVLLAIIERHPEVVEEVLQAER